MEVEKLDVYNAKSGKFVTSLYGLRTTSTIIDVKRSIHLQKSSLTPSRQEIRLEQKSKGLKDDETLTGAGLSGGSGAKIYVKDLGPQVGWSTVFLVEYAGPLVIYLMVYRRPWLLYGDNASSQPISLCTHIAMGCWTAHYAKRLVETKVVHRFSHATMPFFNLFKNCSYYWGFTLYVAYHINHPLFTPPPLIQTYAALATFVMCELGNLSIHMALRDLRPPGSKVRCIPYPNANPLTALFNSVSCPNYTYEFGAWLSFTIMTQCLPAGLFALCGFYQMTMWALGKHRNYYKEFKSYPKRKAILPFLI